MKKGKSSIFNLQLLGCIGTPEKSSIHLSIYWIKTGFQSSYSELRAQADKNVVVVRELDIRSEGWLLKASFPQSCCFLVDKKICSRCLFAQKKGKESKNGNKLTHGYIYHTVPTKTVSLM